jgi:hypothetical protein
MVTRKKSKHPEYRLLITSHINERTEEPTTLFVLETAQSFASFRYELSVEEKVAKESITFTILGLKAPGLSLPSSGRARFTREFANLKGPYDITVVGLDGRASVCSIVITRGRVEIKSRPSGPGLRVATDTAQFPQE